MMEFNPALVRFCIKRIGDQWGIACRYLGDQRIYVVIPCGTLQQAQQQYYRVRENRELVYNKVKEQLAYIYQTA